MYWKQLWRSSLSNIHHSESPTMDVIHILHGSRLYYPRNPFSSPPKTLISVSPSLTHFFKSRSFTSLRNQTLQKPTQKPSKTPKKKGTFTIDYLINSCGLSHEAAITTSQKFQIASPTKPDTVLSLLKKCGFSKTQISVLVRKRPLLLLANPENTLLPKIEFFYSIGVSTSDLARTLTSDPTLLTRSLENQIIPSYNYLKSVLLSDEKIVAALKRTTWIFLEDHSKNLIPNVNFLLNLGVPLSCVALLLTHFPEAMMQRHELFVANVNEVKEMGFDPKKSTFVLAVHALSGSGNKAIWDRCLEVYMRWSWSKDDVLNAFKKHPHCMMLSEKKIMRGMEFFVNKMGWSPKDIANCPVVLFFSLEKRIIPRCRVARVLMDKGLIKEDLSLSTLLVPAEKFFLERFVSRYEEEIPQLSGVYEGKISPEDV